MGKANESRNTAETAGALMPGMELQCARVQGWCCGIGCNLLLNRALTNRLASGKSDLHAFSVMLGTHHCRGQPSSCTTERCS
jgi:hypothetical protein